MQTKTIATDISTTGALIAATRLMCPPGGVLEGSLAFVQLALRGGLTPAFVFVIEPTMTPQLEAQMARWVADPDITFNTAVVLPQSTTFLKAKRFSAT